MRSCSKLPFPLMCFESSAYSWSYHEPSTQETASYSAISDGGDQDGRPQMGGQPGSPCRWSSSYILPLVSASFHITCMGESHKVAKLQKNLFLRWTLLLHHVIWGHFIFLYPRNLPPGITCLDALQELQEQELNPVPDKVGMNPWLFSPCYDGHCRSFIAFYCLYFINFSTSIQLWQF